MNAFITRYKRNEALVHDSSLRMTKMIMFVSIMVWPSWIIFDYFFARDYMGYMLFVNLFFGALIGGCLVLLKRGKISNTLAQYIVVIPALTHNALYINIVEQEYVFLYFVIGGILLGMVVYAFMLLPPVRAIAFTIYSMVAIISMNTIVGKHDLSFILDKGLVIYSAVALFGISLSFAKYRFTVATELKNEIISEQKAQLEVNLKETEEAYKERNLYLNEMQHRVQNNLQMIYSLVKLQEGYKDEKALDEVLESLQNKVLSISTIHELLYASDTKSAIDFSDYVRTLCDHYNQAFQLDEKRIKIEHKVDLKEIDLTQIFPCGLIINELITNSIKHAFEGKEAGLIEVLAHDSEDFIHLTIKDNGIGDLDSAAGLGSPRKEADEKASGGLGITLIKGLVAQLDGDLNYTSESGVGTEFSVKFKKRGKAIANTDS